MMRRPDGSERGDFLVHARDVHDHVPRIQPAHAMGNDVDLGFDLLNLSCEFGSPRFH